MRILRHFCEDHVISYNFVRTGQILLLVLLFRLILYENALVKLVFEHIAYPFLGCFVIEDYLRFFYGLI